MALFTMWEGDESGIILKRGPDKPDRPGEEDAVKVKEFRASSWNEACQIQCDHYGWGVCRPHDRWEVIGPDED